MTDEMFILKHITNKDEMSGIIHFLINKKKLIVINPENTDLSFNSNSRILTCSNINIDFFELKWKNLFFKIFISVQNELVEFNEIKIFQDKEQSFLPQSWNNLVKIDGSVFIGDIVFFENDKIWVEFDSDTFTTNKLNESPATIMFSEETEVITLLECNTITEYKNKIQISFSIKEDFAKIQSIFETGNKIYINELLDDLYLDMFQYRIRGD